MSELQSLKATLSATKALWIAGETEVGKFPLLVRQRMLGAMPSAEVLSFMAGTHAPAALTAPFDPAVDWRNRNGNHVTPVRNQGGCGACVSFACVGLLESMFHLEHGEFVDLSEADSHFCSNHGANCEGWWPDVCLREIQNRGVVDEGSFPYASAFPNNDIWQAPPVCRVVTDRINHMIKPTSQVQLNNPADVKSYLTSVGPVAGCITVFEDFFHYRSGVYHHVQGNAVGGHCMLVIGYSEAEQCWIVKNSWDTTWGMNGFGKIAYSDFKFNGSFFPMYGARGTLRKGLPSGPKAQGDLMQPGQVLNPDDRIVSADGRYHFCYQGDGNLVLYRDGHALWASGTDGKGVGVCIMQGDGNLVLYVPGPQAIWASNTAGSSGSRLVVQGDGNVVIYRPDNHAVWATNTWLPTGPKAQGDLMQPGQVLNPNDRIVSADGRYHFCYQGDGNLVLYRDGHALWASGTDGKGVGVCIMQGDGNLVIYTPGGHAIWASNTAGSAGSRLVVQGDGNVVIYRPDNHAVWATNTWLPTGPKAQGDLMQPGQVLNPDDRIVSADGRYHFCYQGDGNLVLYRDGHALWASGTDGKGVGVCIMQGDGNLVIYTPGGHAIWASNTAGSAGSRLVVQGDGNVVMYRPDNHAIWATNTVSG